MRSWFIGGTTAQTVIKQFKALAPKQRAEAAKAKASEKPEKKKVAAGKSKAAKPSKTAKK